MLDTSSLCSTWILPCCADPDSAYIRPIIHKGHTQSIALKIADAVLFADQAVQLFDALGVFGFTDQR